MKLKTIKKRLRFLHRTAKKYVKSGGGRPLNPHATSWQPIRVSPTGAESSSAASPRATSPVAVAAAAAVDAVDAPVNEATQVAAYFAGLGLLKVAGNPAAINTIENAYAIDCEMVGIGPLKYDNYGGTYRDSTLARVTIVDFKGRKKLDKYVIPKEGLNAITNYRTPISGIKPEHLARLIPAGSSYRKITDQVKSILKNRIIVGHGLKSDFDALGFKPEVPYMVWDTAKIDAYMKNTRYGRGAKKLKELVKDIVGHNIQKEGHPHSPLEDAKSAMNLYRMNFGYDKLPL